MASVESRDIAAEAARLEAIALGAGEALACAHENAEELHRSLVREFFERKQKRGVWARMRAMSLFSL
jgi:hypothetical protein